MDDIVNANELQNTPSAEVLDEQIKADEAARNTPEPTEQPEVTEPAEPEPEIKEPQEDNDYEKRIARLAFKERESRNLARQLQEENARLKGQAPPLDKDADIEKQVEERAAQLAAIKVYNDKANQVYKDGVKEFPDFDVKIAALREAGLPLSNQVVEAAIEIGDPHKLIHYLGRNLDEAERIMGLPAHQMGAALAKLTTKLTPPPKPQSKAPAPIKPLAGKGKAELNDEQMPIDEYMRREDDRIRSRYYSR